MAGELPPLDPLKLIAPVSEEIWHRMGSKVAVKMVELDEHVRAEALDSGSATEEHCEFGTLDVYFEEIWLNGGCGAKVIERDGLHSELLRSVVNVDGPIARIVLTVRHGYGDFTGVRKEGQVERGDVLQIIELHIFLQKCEVAGKRLEREDAARGPGKLGEKKRVIPDVGADVDDGHARLDGGNDGIDDLRLPGAIDKAAEALPVDAHAVALERTLARVDLGVRDRDTVEDVVKQSGDARRIVRTADNGTAPGDRHLTKQAGNHFLQHFKKSYHSP